VDLTPFAATAAAESLSNKYGSGKESFQSLILTVRAPDFIAVYCVPVWIASSSKVWRRDAL